MTTLEMRWTSAPKELIQIQGKVLWCDFKEIDKSAKHDNEFDKNEVDKNEAKSHMITGFMTSALQLICIL